MKAIIIFIISLISLSAIGQSSSYNQMLTTGSTIQLEPEVATYSANITSAGGTLSLTETRAHNIFVGTAKALGIWGKIRDMCTFSGGWQGMLIKLKIDPSISGFNDLENTGNTLDASSYLAGGGLYIKPSQQVKSRLTLSQLPFNNFCLASIRTANNLSNSGGCGGMGYNQTPLNPQGTPRGLGVTGSGYFTMTPRSSTDTKANHPFYGSGFLGIHTINHAPTTGTAYKKTTMYNTSTTGVIVEDQGTVNAWTTPAGEIAITGVGENGGQAASTFGYVIADGLTDSELILLQNLLMQLHNNLGRTDLTINNNAERLFFIGDSFLAGVGATGVGQYYGNQYSAKYNIYSRYLGWDPLSGRQCQDYITDFDNGRYNFINGFHRSVSNNNYVYIELGHNDLGNGATASTLKTRVESLCSRFSNAGYRPVYVMPLKLINWSGSAIYNTNYNSQIDAFINLIVADADFFNGVKAWGVVRIDEVPELQNPNNTTYFNDGLHLKDAGYDFYANKIGQTHIALFHNGVNIDYSNRVASATIMDGFAFWSGTNINGRQLQFPTSKTWTVVGDLNIQNWGVQPTNTTVQTNIATTDGNANGQVRCWFNRSDNISNPMNPRVIFRYADANNYMSAEIIHTGNFNQDIRLFRTVGGVRTQLATASLAYAASYYIDVTFNNLSIQVSTNVATNHINTTISSTGLESNTKIGFALNVATTGFSTQQRAFWFSAK